MSRFDEGFYDNNATLYELVMFLENGQLNIPFTANGKELNQIFKLHSRPKWLRPRNFGVTTNNGTTILKIDLTKVIVIEANEKQAMNQRRAAQKIGEAAQTMNSTNGTEA